VRIDTAERPQLLAIPGGRRLVLDGHIVDPSTGRDLGTLANAYAGNGRELVRTDDLRGISFNGQALQAFRGDHATGAAIVYHPGQPGFLVAHLEELAHRRGVQLVIYGPGGARTHALPVADCALVTGDRAEISRIHARPQRPLFDARHAPLALLGPNRTAIAIVPLLGADRSLPNQLVAFDLPSGDERWRRPTPGVRAILGPRSIIVGTGDTVIAFDAWTGEPSDPLPCRGLPVALGDPFDSGHIHLITASPDGIELLRGPACAPGAMTWSGARGDLWRSGTLTAAGTPFGPL